MQVVTGNSLRVTKNLDGRTYTLRAPTYAEAGRLADQLGQEIRPTQTIVNDELREALKRVGREDVTAAVDEHEAALDVLQGATMAVQTADDPENKRLLMEARARFAAAQRGRERAEWLVREDEALRDLRKLAGRMNRQDSLAVLAICLLSWEGEGMPERPETLTVEFIAENLPEGDVTRLAEAANALFRPTQEVEKN